MGKAGGFFKRLKNQQKKSASKKSRGTSGASKKERIAKHNAAVDIYAAKRLVEELDNVSESSGDQESTDSEAEVSGPLAKLRASLGVAETHSVASSDSLPPDDEEDEEEELEFLDENDMLAEEEEDEPNSDSEELDEETFDGIDVDDVERDIEEDDIEEDEESEAEEAFASHEEGNDSSLMLEMYALKSAKGADAVVAADDLIWKKYYADELGASDTTATNNVWPSAIPEVSVNCSQKAVSALKHVWRRNKKGKLPLQSIHPILWEKWCRYRSSTSGPLMTEAESAEFNTFASYADVLDATRTYANGAAKMELAVLHLLNHWFKSRLIVAENDRRQATSDADESVRDQGFGKTRIMVCLPMRNIAKKYVDTIVKILGFDQTTCHKLEQFEQDFSEMEEAVDPKFKRRPLDYRRQFEGNIDDSFCFGVSLKADRMSIYSHVLNSDILICSPLGLRKRMEKNGDCTVALSSIEVLVIDEAHVLMMQNWDQLVSVLGMINKRPTDTTKGLNDVNRIFPWALEGRSSRHRQSIIITELTSSDILATFRSFKNNSGRMICCKSPVEGVLSKVMIPIRQHFLRFSPESLPEVDEARFNFFTEEMMKNKIYPLIERGVRTILFVPSYFDFVRVRNFLHRDYRESYTAISEFSSQKSLRRSLGQFTDLERPLLVMTERFYYFKRYFVKMAEVLIFLSPPQFPEFYCGLIGKLSLTPNSCVMTIYCRYDTHELARLCGTVRTAQLLARDSEAFSFVTQ